jgi:hypothetical protein
LQSIAVLPLIRVLFDMTLLRNGPEDIPRSWLMLYMCVGLWVLGLVATTVLIQNFNTAEAWVGLASWVLGLICYVVILIFMGYSNRSLQTVAAIAGVGAIISFAMLAELVLLTPILGSNLANFGAVLILFWSVPVKGHIIARAIERHWYIGIVFATSIFALQFAFTSALTLER